MHYRDRNKILNDLGYSSYSEYLGSALWKGIRRRFWGYWKHNHDNKCFLCSSDAEIPHHQNYSRAVLVGKKIKGNIYGICESCHLEIEFSEGEKNQFPRVCKLFRRKRQEYKHPRGSGKGRKRRRKKKVKSPPADENERRCDEQLADLEARRAAFKPPKKGRKYSNVRRRMV